MLGKVEGVLLYLMRVVMVLLALFTLFTFGIWTYENLRKPQAEAFSTVDESRDWSGLKISEAELKKITYSDFGFADSQQVINDNKLAADAAVVAAFADVDKQLRAALMRDPKARSALDEANMETGLAPARPLPALVKALQEQELAGQATAALDATSNPDSAEDAAVATAVAAAAEAAASADDYQPEPTDIGDYLLSQTRQVISSYGYNAGHAFVLGAPAAMQQLLADAQVQKGITRQSTSYVVSNLLMNYNMVFSSKAGESTSSEGNTWLERMMEPSSLLVYTVLLWSFVFLMMIVVFLRVERHLRAMAAEGKAMAQRSQI